MHNLVKEKICLDQKIGKEVSQLLLEGDIIVPDVKPDMSVILQTDSSVCINKVELSNDRVNFMGRLDISVLYLAKGAEKPVHSMNISTHIDDFINMDGITKEMWGDVKASIANIEYKMLNDRKINYRAIVDVTVSGEYSEMREVVVDIDDIPESQCLKSSLNLNKSVENKVDKFIVKDEITIPSGKPNIREILQCTVDINNKDIRVSNGKININGELTVTTLYKCDDDISVIEFLENEIPFNGAVEVANARDDMFSDVTLTILDKYLQIKPDSDGEDRVIEIEVTISSIIKVSMIETLQVLKDAYIINEKLNLNKIPVKYPKLVCRNKNQTPIKEIIQMDEGTPDMLQIYRIAGKPYLDMIKVMDDKVLVEGVIETNVLYVAESDNTPLFSFNTILPYKQLIETKGTKQNMNVSVDVNIDHIGFNLLSGREVEVRFLMSFNTQVNEEKESIMITDIDFCEMEQESLDGFSSISVYSVQPGDNLFEIAKMFNTTINEIVELNALDNPNHLQIAQKLLILKKV
ncbi:MAG: DUF3794 domain-containing protein [Clostridiales bacterium]|jgi:hypothetical protein|nr:DUF3794 domain-containing protein [Clostridiales bacterium]